MPKHGKFLGTLRVEYSNNGKTIKLLEDISFIDSKDKKWTAKKGMPSDGASIPRTFWTLIGSPLQGPYVRPAVIHDQYCITRTEPWKMVHWMFYEAMLVAGVGKIKAKTMYTAVMSLGPRWDEMTVEGARIAFSQTTKKAGRKKRYLSKVQYRKGETISSVGTSIEPDFFSKIQRANGTITEIQGIRSYAQSLKFNIPQNTCKITRKDRDKIIEFAKNNPSIDDIENFSESLRLEKGIHPRSWMLDTERYKRQQKIHIIQSNDQNYLIECTLLGEKYINKLVNGRIKSQCISNNRFEARSRNQSNRTMLKKIL